MGSSLLVSKAGRLCVVWLVWLALMAITSSYAMSEDATSEYATSEDATSEEWINSSEPVHINSWAGYDTRGSWLVVDGRVVYLEGLQLGEQWLSTIGQMLTGAIWHRSLLAASLWLQQSSSITKAMQLGSQVWLAWSLTRSLSRIGPQAYEAFWAWQQVASSRYVRGVHPVDINHALLSRRIMLTASLPDDPGEPVSLVVDRVPDLAAVVDLTAQLEMPEGWSELLQELSASGLYQIRMTGSQRKVSVAFLQQNDLPVTVTHQLPGNASFDWVLGRVRGKTVNRYTASLLSPNMLKTVTQMLTCVRTHNNAVVGDAHSGFCRTGSLQAQETSGDFVWSGGSTDVSLLPVSGTDEYRLPVSHCAQSREPLCWQSSLLIRPGTILYPWKQLVLNIQEMSVEDRNADLLWGGCRSPKKTEAVLIDNAYLRRVPGWMVELMMDAIDIVGQRVISRWIGKGLQQVVGRWHPHTVDSITDTEAFSGQALKSCPLCCESPSSAQWVDPGCGKDDSHGLCLSCFFWTLGDSKLAVYRFTVLPRTLPKTQSKDVFSESW